MNIKRNSDLKKKNNEQDLRHKLTNSPFLQNVVITSIDKNW